MFLKECPLSLIRENNRSYFMPLIHARTQIFNMVSKLLLYQLLSEKDRSYNPILHVYQPMEDNIRLSIIYLIKHELSQQV
jgi:hypothetical protein